MGDSKITRDVYRQYAHKITSVLEDDQFYEQFRKRVDNGASSFKLGKKRLIQDISIDWIDTIEAILPNLDTIVRNPRRFIVQEEDIVDVSLARSISTESVKFLAQHTNMISKVEDDGSVIPSKILNITKEESFEIYENRFIYTLLLKLKDFITMRYDKIKKASATQDVLELDIESRFNLPSKKVTMRTEYFAQLSFDEVMRLDPDTLTKIERVAKMDRIVTDFLSSSFAKSMRNSAPVRPPIMRTNVILKEPNFKKALTLWQFIETYNATGGFSTSDEVENYTIEDADVENLRHMVTLNTMLFESLYEEYESDMNMEDKEFADFLRVGEMQFEKDNIERDQYAQKLDEKVENEEEQENLEEVKGTESEEAEKELPEEQPPEQPQEQEPQQTEEKQVVQEQEVERPVEVERLKEMPPKAEQEEVDLEPDAEKFDQHLYDVRRLYKRPDDDKLKQEDIVKVRDAIDRCLTSYRRIKQEEIDERERQDRIARRKEDMRRRADAFAKQREALSGTVDSLDSDDVFFGMDPFSYQKAKLAAEKKEEERKLKYDKNEKLELEGANEEIEKEIADMEAARAEAQAEEQAEAPEELVANQPEPEPEQPAEEIEAPVEQPKRKRKIRIAKEQDAVDPWTSQPKEQKNIEAVDESKVAVGGIRFADGTDIDNPFGGISNRAEVAPEVTEPAKSEEEPPKPKRKRKPRQPKPVAPEEKPADNAESAPESAESAESAKPARNSGEISATTRNQKYSKPSGRQRNIEAVDESKVAVGGIRFADGTDIDNPFGGISNRAEVAPKVAEPAKSEAEEEKPKPKRTRKPRQPKPAAPAEEAKPEEKPADNAETTPASAESSEPAKPAAESAESAKPSKTARNSGKISATTRNQKYSKPSGRQRNIEAVDESKVSIGGIRFAKGSGIEDPFADVFALGNRAEESEPSEQENGDSDSEE